MPIDRSISALRTLRPDRDASIFWFRDDLHQPYPISPMGMTTIQKHHAWGYHVASEQTQLPPSKGAHVKLYKGRVYLGFALIDDPDGCTLEVEVGADGYGLVGDFFVGVTLGAEVRRTLPRLVDAFSEYVVQRTAGG